jgi:hypothetical protein
MTHIRSALSLAVLGCTAFVPAGRALTLPGETVIPVIFTKTIDSGKAKAGDVVTAKTIQVVLLPNGEQLAKGSLVTGHVVEARPFKFDETPYAAQQPSYLSIQIDHVVNEPVSTSLRALATALAVQEALTPQGTDESDTLGTMVLVGGAHYSPIAKRVTDGPDDDIVGYNKRQGVFARLLSGGAGCAGTQTEQSVAIFSPDACGLYGFVGEYLSAKSGTFRLESTHRTVTIHKGSAALLQVQ